MKVTTTHMDVKLLQIVDGMEGDHTMREGSVIERRCYAVNERWVIH